MATIVYGSWVNFVPGGALTVRDTVVAALGDQVADVDLDGLIEAYRDAINAALAPRELRLVGEEFHGPEGLSFMGGGDVHPIEAAIASVDLDALALDFDNSGNR